MRMKAGTRVIFTLYILVVVLLCLFLLGIMFGVFHPAILTASIDTIVHGSFWFKLLYAAIFAILIIIGIALLFFGIKKDAPRTAKVAELENGTVLITVSAVKELVEKYVKRFDEIKETDVKVTSNTDSIDIDLNVMVDSDTNIPELTESLQNSLVENIEKNTGIKIQNNKIVVTGIKETEKQVRAN